MWRMMSVEARSWRTMTCSLMTHTSPCRLHTAARRLAAVCRMMPLTAALQTELSNHRHRRHEHDAVLLACLPKACSHARPLVASDARCVLGRRPSCEPRIGAHNLATEQSRRCSFLCSGMILVAHMPVHRRCASVSSSFWVWPTGSTPDDRPTAAGAADAAAADVCQPGMSFFVPLLC